MANTPVPKSFADIVGAMVDSFLSKIGLPSIRVGSPALSIIEAAAQSDLRTSQDVFAMLNSTSLDRATGNALDKIGLDESLPRIGEAPSSGLINILDTTFTKLSTKIFQGTPAPIIGSSIVNVSDATLFPASGSIYIGRGTINYEGPLAYSSKVNNGNYWTLNLAGGNNTRQYHNLGESVILAQGGNRLITAGTIVQTPQGNAGTSIQFATLFTATIPDGETEIDNVTVVARLPGVIGNVVAGSITSFLTVPFNGASATNPLPYTNGVSTEADDTYRERIRNVRQSRSKGTALSIVTNEIGITSPDENKTILSASVVTRAGFPTTLYIDDGTGYEEVSTGIAFETLADQALGGEQYFQLVNGRPVAKAFALSQLSAPFSLQAGAVLGVLIGGQLSLHLFNASDFRSISSASAFEITASINGDSTLLFNARTVNSGTQVALFAKSDTNEDVQVVVPVGFIDANTFFGFGAGRVDSLRLYKNDRLLFKDGLLATVVSNTQGFWAPTSSGETLSITVDGILIPPSLSTIVDADFVNAGTGFNTVSTTNPLAAWAAVLNFKIPGITATVTGGTISITSNRGRSATASVAIGSCTLVTKGVFNITSSVGKNFDYELDRNLGQIRLNDSLILSANDKLTAGSLATRGFIESTSLNTITINNVATSVAGQNGAELWFAVDGNTSIVKTGVGPGTQIIYSIQAAVGWGKRVRLTALTNVFANVVAGNWVIVNDTAVPAANQGAWHVANVDVGGTWIEIEVPTAWAYTATINLNTGGITIVNTTAELQRVFITTAGNYTATSLVSAITLRGATASTYRTTKIRVRTNRFAIGGDIALVAANSEGLKLTLPVASATINQTSHLAAIEAGNSESGTPQFSIDTVFATSAPDTITPLFDTFNSGQIVVALKDLNDGGGGKVGNKGHISPITVRTGGIYTLRRPVIENWLTSDRIYAASPYAITGVDQLTAVLDGDTTSHRFVMPLFRRCTPTTNTYGITNTLQDKDNSNASLAQTFGVGMNWLDFAVFMHARTKSSQVAGVDTNKTILWRDIRLGSEGNNDRLAYTYPLSANQSLLASANSFLNLFTQISIQLPSGAARTGILDSNSTKIGHTITALAGFLYTYEYVFNLPIPSASREIRLDYITRNATSFVGGMGPWTITGGTSGATAQVSADSLPGGGGGSGTLTINTVVGTFLNGETLTGSSGASAKVSGSQYGVAKLTLTLPTGVTNHGFSIGNKLFMNYNVTGTGAGFTTGVHTVLEVPSGTQINYIEGTTSIPTTLNVGNVSYDISATGLGSSNIIVGDIFNVGINTSLPAIFQQSIKIQTLTDGDVSGQSPTAGAISGTLVWDSINNVSNISFFPLNAGSCTIVAIAATVNAQTTSPVTAVAVGTGLDNSGSILYATYEASPNGLGGSNPYYYFSDGLNWVRSTNTPATPANNFIFTFKDAVTASLATNSDWLNEDIRLVPITADNITNYLNTPGPGGLFASSEIVIANQGGRPQIATVTLGSLGSVQIQGGTANGISSSIIGSAVAVNVGTPSMVVNIAYSDTQGLSGGHWVKVQNTNTVTKTRITSSTALTSIATNGTVILSGTTAWDWAGMTTGPIIGTTWQIEKQGNFVAFVYSSGPFPTLTNVSEGDWVHISSQISGTVNARNQGLFRIVRIDTANNIFWIVNPNVLEEVQTTDLAFLTYDSIVPGDSLIINTSLWGINNLGTWTISGIDLTTYNSIKLNYASKTAGWAVGETVTGETSAATGVIASVIGGAPGAAAGTVVFSSITGTFLNGETLDGSVSGAAIAVANGTQYGNTNNTHKFNLNVSTRTPQAVGAVGALGANSGLVQVIEAAPSILYKKILGININPNTSTLADIKFDTQAGYTKVSSAAGSVISSLDKLNFPETIANGIDGYQHSTGLIAEANKVGNGDESDPATYPGVIAAGANVNIQGPLVRRIQVSLLIRARTGVSILDIEDQIKSSVASLINATGVGVSISISDIIGAAEKVNGVISVVILSPAFGPGSDLIDIQPFEKPLVLNLDQDVLVSFVGN